MCWNKEVSISTFILISVICYGLYKRNLKNDRMMSIFIMTYGLMQLVETIIWIGIEYNKPKLNMIGTILVCVLLYIHPLGLMLGIKYDKLYKNTIKTSLFKIFFVLTILLFVIGIINIIVNKTDYLSYITEKSVHLVWKKPKYLEIQYKIGMIIVFLIIIGFIYPKNKAFGLFLLLFLSITGIYSYITSYKGKNIVFGSYWCWVVAIWAFLIYFINPHLQHFNIMN
jgi:hypothetical protein